MPQKSRKLIYLDHASATPIDPKVRQAMATAQSHFANPSSLHTGGLQAKKILEDSRKKIADLIFAHSDEIIFTGSGTESIALAIIGAVVSYDGPQKPHIITTSIEHPAVIENCKMLDERKEAEVTFIAPDKYGFIDPKNIKEKIKKNTILVSVMYANNEIGAIEPIREIAKEIRHYRKNNNSKFPLFHTDACQAINYLETENIERLGVDLMSFNSSKIYGPKGIAALYKKRGIKLSPVYSGGGQEFGLRSGTENITLALGFAKAFEETAKIKIKESKRLSIMRDYAIEKLLSMQKNSGYEIILNGDRANRLPNNINISIVGISSELILIELDAREVEVSSKSACKSDDKEESHVIKALRKVENKKTNTTEGSIRISLGRSTTKKDIDYFLKSLEQILSKYRAFK